MPVTPTAFNLHNGPLCQTLSKALLMSQNTTVTLTSFPEFNASQNVSYKYVNWFEVESPGVKPDWWGVSILFTWRRLYKCLKTERSNVFSILLNKAIGRWFDTIEGSPGFGPGVMWERFHNSGTSPSANDRLNRSQKGNDRCLLALSEFCY